MFIYHRKPTNKAPLTTSVGDTAKHRSSRRSVSSGFMRWPARHVTEPREWREIPHRRNWSHQIKRQRGCPLEEGLERRFPSRPQCSEFKERQSWTPVRSAGLEKVCKLNCGEFCPLPPYSGLILSLSRTDHTYFFTTTSSASAHCLTDYALNKYLPSE